VVTVDDTQLDSVDGETNGTHAYDMYGCAIGHHDERVCDRNVG
jgi:hypothetical protein